MGGEEGVEGTYEDFDVVKEPWCYYTIKDTVDVPAKGKFILLSVKLRRPEKDRKKMEISISGHNLFVIMPPPSLRGPPQTLPPVDEIQESEKSPVPFEVKTQDSNIYLLRNGIVIRANLVVIQVFKTEYYDKNGDPLYIFNSQLISEITPDR